MPFSFFARVITLALGGKISNVPLKEVPLSEFEHVSDMVFELVIATEILARMNVHGRPVGYDLASDRIFRVKQELDFMATHGIDPSQRYYKSIVPDEYLVNPTVMCGILYDANKSLVLQILDNACIESISASKPLERKFLNLSRDIFDIDDYIIIRYASYSPLNKEHYEIHIYPDDKMVFAIDDGIVPTDKFSLPVVYQ